MFWIWDFFTLQSKVRTVFGRGLSITASEQRQLYRGWAGRLGVAQENVWGRWLKLSQTNSKPLHTRQNLKSRVPPCSGERFLAQPGPGQPPGTPHMQPGWRSSVLHGGGSRSGANPPSQGFPCTGHTGISSTEGMTLSVVSPLWEGQSNSGISIGGIFFTCQRGERITGPELLTPCKHVRSHRHMALPFRPTRSVGVKVFTFSGRMLFVGGPTGAAKATNSVALHLRCVSSFSSTPSPTSNVISSCEICPVPWHCNRFKTCFLEFPALYSGLPQLWPSGCKVKLVTTVPHLAVKGRVAEAM